MPVDAALRPEGSRGPLVRTLSSHVAYYRRWARTWEFQALLKARPVAGDQDLGHEWLAALDPLVWHAAERPEAVDDVRAMRRRIVANVPAAERDREIKRGPGGLRDIEFAVQLLQLVHGRLDPDLRSPTTLVALAELGRAGYVDEDDASRLAEAYRFLRRLEHRLQLREGTQVYAMPAAEAEQAARPATARVKGCPVKKSVNSSPNSRCQSRRALGSAGIEEVARTSFASHLEPGSSWSVGDSARRGPCASRLRCPLR